MFVVCTPLAAWVKSTDSPFWRSWLTQAVLASPVALLVFFIEERVIWRWLRQNVFSTIHPVSLGSYVGYVVHFAF